MLFLLLLTMFFLETTLSRRNLKVKCGKEKTPPVSPAAPSTDHPRWTLTVFTFIIII